jgi:hypothetical protein
MWAESGTGHDRLITLTEGVLPEEEREDPEPLDELIGQQGVSRELRIQARALACALARGPCSDHDSTSIPRDVNSSIPRRVADPASTRVWMPRWRSSAEIRAIASCAPPGSRIATTRANRIAPHDARRRPPGAGEVVVTGM